jgi:mobilome CxxCx(11)CxxC protein
MEEGLPVSSLTSPELDYDNLRRECWNGALHTYGTSYIFQQRAQRLNRRLRLLTYSGVALPLIVGATVLSFGLDIVILPVMVAIVAPLVVMHVLASAWAVVDHWVDAHTYANESATANDQLARRYEALAKNPPTAAEFKSKYDLVCADDSSRTQQDMRKGMTDKEKRKGMRAALRQYQRQCATCQQTPTSMSPTSCDTCGNF